MLNGGWQGWVEVLGTVLVAPANVEVLELSGKSERHWDILPPLKALKTQPGLLLEMGPPLGTANCRAVAGGVICAHGISLCVLQLLLNICLLKVPGVPRVALCNSMWSPCALDMCPGGPELSF